jgi:hypothetical protein
MGFGDPIPPLAGHFSTLHLLASLPENQLVPDGAKWCFPVGAPLQRPGIPKNLE